MRKITIIWTITLVCIITGLTLLGFKMKQDNKGNWMEDSLVEQGKKYLGLYPGLYPKKGDTLKLTADELNEEGYKITMEDDCTGYLVVTNGQAGYEYKPYVSCTDYKTDGYLEE